MYLFAGPLRGALAKTTHVVVDGREVILHGDVGAVPVDPGTRTIRVERAGNSVSEQSVSMTTGVFRVIEVQGDRGAVVDASDGRTEDRHASWPVPCWVASASRASPSGRTCC